MPVHTWQPRVTTDDRNISTLSSRQLRYKTKISGPHPLGTKAPGMLLAALFDEAGKAHKKPAVLKEELLKLRAPESSKRSDPLLF
jgi:hypothetical protein